MGLLDLFRSHRQRGTAAIAKERLQILVAHDRATRNQPSYLPRLQQEILEVIRKYVNVDVEAVKVDLVKDGEHDVLDISVSLPDGRAATA